jgi:hypothetical protein
MFANPLFLFGLLGAAVPVIIHLIFRRKRTAMDLPTLMFLRRVEMKLASRRNLKELLLLTLRALAIVFVVLALARPGFNSSNAANPGSAAADCVLIIDNSASMSLKLATGTRLDAARAQAAAILNTLGAEGRAAILTTVPSEAALETDSLNGDKQKLLKSLQSLQPTAGSGALTGTLARAAEILDQSSTAPNREIYILGDFQKNAFKDEAALRTAVNGLPARTSVFLCPIPGGAPSNNLSLISVVTDPRPKVTGRKISLIAKVKNNSLSEQATTLTSAFRDQTPLQQNITLAPGAVQDVPLSLTLGQEGFAAGEVKLDADDAAFDNVWPFCIEVRGPIRVLVLSPGGEKREDLEDSFYLRKALDPTGDGRLSGIRVTHNIQSGAPQKSLEGFDAVVLAGCTALPPATLKLLDDFVEHGGGLMIFAGRKDAELAANHPLQKLLGGKISGEFTVAKDQPALTLRAVQPAAPYFEDSRTTDGRVEFKDVAVLKALKTEANRDASVLAEFSDGHPAIVLQPRGQGRILWWTLSPNADDSNLPLMPSFLSLLHCSVSVLCNAQSQVLERKAGQPLILDFSGPAAKSAPPAALTLFDPDEKSYEIPLAGGRLTWRDTGRAGIYRLQPKASSNKEAPAVKSAVPPGFAVVPDPDEGEVDYLSGSDVQRALGVKNATIIPTGTDVSAAIAATRQGRELFGTFIFLALLMVLAEAMLANAIGTRAPAKIKIEPAKSSAAPSGLNLTPVEAATRPATSAAEKAEAKP